MKLTRGRLAVAMLILGAFVAVAVWAIGKPNSPEHRPPRIVAELRERPADEPLLGDPVNGGRVYEIQCVSCHGYEGRGDGPAASYLPIPPRNHTDGAYMDARTDARLFEVIKLGGKQSDLSALMPASEETMDDLTVWDLVAHLRTLHPRAADYFAGAAPGKFHEVILSDPARRVSYLELPGGYLIQSAVTYDGVAFTLCVALDRSFEIVKASTQERVVLVREGVRDGRGVDVFMESGTPIRDFEDLVGAISGTRENLAQAVKEAVAQEAAEVAAATEIYDQFLTDPSQFPTTQRAYLANCMPCHGATGSLLGPPVDPNRLFRPRNFADGAYLSKRSNEILFETIKYGGSFVHVSGSMPSYTNSLSDEQIRDLVTFLRSMARPPVPRVCACGLAQGKCGEAQADGCVCTQSSGPDHICRRSF